MTAARALPTLAEINEQQLKLDAELRAMLDQMLKARDETGRVFIKPGLSVLDLQRSCVAYALLNKMDRIALGVSDDRPPALLEQQQQENKYDEMSEEELIEELKRVRARSIIN